VATILQYGIGDSSTVDESQTTDNSRAYGGTQNATTGQLGSNVSVNDAAGATLTFTDQGAIVAAKEIALRSLDEGSATLQALSTTAEEISKRGLDLASQAAAGQGGQLIKGVLILAAVLVAGWGATEYFKKKG
jgi:hypothetical protein